MDSQYAAIKSEADQDFQRAASFARLALDAETSADAKSYHGLARFYWARVNNDQ